MLFVKQNHFGSLRLKKVCLPASIPIDYSVKPSDTVWYTLMTNCVRMRTSCQDSELSIFRYRAFTKI